MVATLTEYQAPTSCRCAVAFPPVVVDSLAAYLSRLGLRQLHVAETEKYAHVTYFFNGGVEEPLPGRGAGPGAVAARRRRPTTWRREMSAPDRSPTRSWPASARATSTSSWSTTPTPTWSATPGSGTRRCGPRSSIDGCLARLVEACAGRRRRAAHHRRPRQHRGDARPVRRAADQAHHRPRPARAGRRAVAGRAGCATASWPTSRRPSATCWASRRRPVHDRTQPDRRLTAPTGRRHPLIHSPAMTPLIVAQGILAVALIAAILLQQRGTGLGGAFGGEVTAYRSRRGIERTLFRLTIVLAVLFVIFSLLNLLPQTAEPSGLGGRPGPVLSSAAPRRDHPARSRAEVAE